MKIKAILFDFDDTLFQTKTIKVEAFRYWAKKFYNLEYSVKDIHGYWGIPFAKFIEELVQGKEDVESATEKYYSILPLFVTKPYPGTLRTLRKLEKRFVLGILSSASLELVTGDMKRGKFPADMFSYIQGDGQSDYHKPDSRVFAPALDYFLQKGIKPSEIVYIGDSMSDFLAAKPAGLNFFGIAGRGVDSSEWEKVGAKYISHISELLIFLNETRIRS